MRKYQHIERATALAIDDVETLQHLLKRQLHELKNIARETNSLLVFSVVRKTCIEIDKSITESLERARKLLK